MGSLNNISVLILGLHYAPESTGNAPYTTALADALRSAGASVTVVTGLPHYPEWKVSDPKYQHGLRWSELHRSIPIIRLRHFVPANPHLMGRLALDLTFFLQAVREVRQSSADILIAVTPTLSAPAAALTRRGDRPVGVLVQDLTGNAAAQSGTTNQRVGGLISRVEHWLLRRATLVGVITPLFADALEAGGLNQGKIKELLNFAHIEPVKSDVGSARARLGWPLNPFTLVHTGNIGRKQGLESLVDAAAILAREDSPPRLVLIGDGNQRRELEHRAAALQVPNLDFVDPLSESDYPYALAAADALLVNERRGVKEMSLPSKLTSYSAAGRPILAAVEPDGITAKTLRSYEAAALCAPGSPTALATAIRALQHAPRQLEHLAGRSQQMFKEVYGRPAAYERYRRFALALVQS